MANKLAGQRAKFSRWRAIFYSTADEQERKRAVQHMATVISEAPSFGFSEEQVTQGEDVPDEVRQLAVIMPPRPPGSEENDERLVDELREVVDTTNLLEIGKGEESVYAYGYRCAPDRLKIGSCAGDVVSRVAAQISTGTPDKPVLLLAIRTHDCRALERALHGVFRLRRRKVNGAGAEWFLATREEVISVYENIVSDGESNPT